ncbi:MAG: DUF1934 domain-containing protein [Firmicutes bacterium]|nr:DUF1934 domain-containing protein [Bacillota bacterium]
MIVTVRIDGEQQTPEGEKNNIELVTEGKFYKKKGIYYIIYEETEVSGMEGTTTTLKISDEKVSMKRYGTNQSKLIFEKGVKHNTKYKTDFGEMLMEIMTSKIDIDLDEKGTGSLYLDYRLNISNSVESRNKLNLKITPKNK